MKRAQMKQLKELTEQSQYDFQPKINRRSKSIVEQGKQEIYKSIEDDVILEDPNVPKHEALYADAKHRLLRHEHIYSKCIDKECTFKPKLVTKDSHCSQQTIQEVQRNVLNNLEK